MKLFKKWGADTASFVAFLGKETKNQTRQMRNLYKNYIDKGDVDSLKKYTVQCGSAMQTSSLYTIAKYHFKLDTTSRKIKKHSTATPPEYRVWSHANTQYNYSDVQNQMQQYIGIRDCNLTPIYERDVVKYEPSHPTNSCIGEVIYMPDYCSYFIGCTPIHKLNIETFEIVGSMDRNYMYDEKGELVKKHEQ